MDDTNPGTAEDGMPALHYALLDDVREVAMCTDAPAAEYAGRQLVRLLCIELGHPLPEPVERDGGLVNIIYGKPIKPTTTAPRPIRDQPQA